jgi:hypothetical protein
LALVGGEGGEGKGEILNSQKKQKGIGKGKVSRRSYATLTPHHSFQTRQKMKHFAIFVIF